MTQPREPHVNTINPTATTTPSMPAVSCPISNETAAFWLIDEAQRDGFKHFLSQFITAHCPACNSRKVFVDGVEHQVVVNDQAQLLAAYFAVCDECSHVWCRSASPDDVAASCVEQTAALDAASTPALKDFNREELYEINDALNEVIQRMCKQGQTPEELKYHALRNIWSAAQKLTAQLLGAGDTPGLQQLRPVVEANIAKPRRLRAKRPQD
jgi:hypothetical protein